MKRIISIVTILFLFMIYCSDQKSVHITGELKKWQKVTLTINGPRTGESAAVNPFLDYRLNVTFNNGDRTYIVPGFYAADGNSAETGAQTGNKWQVRFRPDKEGEWRYRVSYRTGKYIAVSDSVDEGKPVAGDGLTGVLRIAAAEKQGPYSKGRLLVTGERYLKYAETGQYFLKAGADSPENFLAFNDFDGTFYAGDGTRRLGEAGPNERLHTYAPHAGDWKQGDPTWRNGKGKNIIGALNYLASKKMNSVYFLTMNFHGDGKDVWPWIDPYERTRFDCSKLDQWEMVFDHMDRLGILLHVVTQETENELILDNGYTGVLRKLYYRELVARFAHHLAVTWNLGEENGYADFSVNAQNDDMRKQMAEFIKTHDPYKNMVVLHTHSNSKFRDPILKPLLEFEYLDGPSLQVGDVRNVHNVTKKWILASSNTKKQWVCCLDEIGGAHTGVKPDADDPDHDSVRRYALWGNLMAGGAGCEWYFGYQFAHNDLNCEDWRSRDKMWDLTAFAVDFFQKYLPFSTMATADELISGDNNWCFAGPGEIYAVYLGKGGPARLKLPEGTYSVRWYDPRNGGELQQGTVQKITGPGWANIGFPPTDSAKDWMAVVQK
ncbi:DUF5060 domain-containing protein [candidate division KSB1 bacterium]|nr:DUF5060 domain-containing protein [candidate division KSB1 bacterium]